MSLWLGQLHVPKSVWTEMLGQSEESFSSISSYFRAGEANLARFISNVIESEGLDIKRLPLDLVNIEILKDKIESEITIKGMSSDVYIDHSSDVISVLIGYEIMEGLTPEQIVSFSQAKKLDHFYLYIVS